MYSTVVYRYHSTVQDITRLLYRVSAVPRREGAWVRQEKSETYSRRCHTNLCEDKGCVFPIFIPEQVLPCATTLHEAPGRMEEGRSNPTPVII